jgi:hypothetical protein
MKPHSKTCIFCHTPFGENAHSRSREHVIPEFILGSLMIQNVCKMCNSRLGQEVDHLILKDGRVINAINKLHLPELENKILQSGETIGIDTLDGTEKQFQMKDGKPYLIPSNIGPEGIIVPDYKVGDVLKKRIERRKELNWSSGDVKEYIDKKVLPKHVEMEFGEELNFTEIGYTLRRGQVGNLVTFPKWTPGAANRLIAKIIYEIAHYLIPRDILMMCHKDLYSFCEIAMGRLTEQDWRIMLRPDDEPKSPDYYHLIQVLYYTSGYIAIDVDFFGCVNFRGTLRPAGKYSPPLQNGKILEGVGFGMSFIPEQAHKKRLAFRYADGTNKWEEHLIPDL